MPAMALAVLPAEDFDGGEYDNDPISDDLYLADTRYAAIPRDQREAMVARAAALPIEELLLRGRMILASCAGTRTI